MQPLPTAASPDLQEEDRQSLPVLRDKFPDIPAPPSRAASLVLPTRATGCGKGLHPEVPALGEGRSCHRDLPGTCLSESTQPSPAAQERQHPLPPMEFGSQCTLMRSKHASRREARRGRAPDSLSSPLPHLQRRGGSGLSQLQLRGAVTQQREPLPMFQMELTKPCQPYGEDLLPGSTPLPASPEVFPLNPPHLLT